MGVANIVAGITHFCMPREQLHMASGIKSAFFESLGKTSVAFKIHYGAIMIATLAGASVVLGIGTALGMHQGTMLLILRVGAVCGFLVTALSFGLMLKRAMRLSNIWPSLSTHTQETIRADGLPNLDPFGLFSFGLVGLWMVVFNASAINVGALPLWHGMVGCASGVLYISVLAGMLFRAALLIDISAALGCIVVGPLWSIVLAVLLL
jgi:hypothetical protein